MKGQTYVILTIVCGIIIAVFAVINVESVEVNYIFWQRESPLILLILFSVLMGSLLTMVASSIKYFNLKKENKQLQQEISRLSEQMQGTGSESLTHSQKQGQKNNDETTS